MGFFAFAVLLTGFVQADAPCPAAYLLDGAQALPAAQRTSLERLANALSTGGEIDRSSALNAALGGPAEKFRILSAIIARDPREDLRISAVGRLQGPAAPALLGSIARNDRSIEVRRAAIRRLGTLAAAGRAIGPTTFLLTLDPKLLPATLLRDWVAEVGPIALERGTRPDIRALAEQKVRTQLSAHEPVLRADAFKLLLRVCENERTPVRREELATLLRNESDGLTRADLVNSVGGMMFRILGSRKTDDWNLSTHTWATDLFMELMKDPNSSVRHFAEVHFRRMGGGN